MLANYTIVSLHTLQQNQLRENMKEDNDQWTAQVEYLPC